jgi:NAD(P)-dependent dehydrogenase (short-subunit alcohol dehydrogenase family)
LAVKNRYDPHKEVIDMNRFEDRVILITGAASGIGRASAIRLAQEGGKIVCVDIQQEAVEETAAEIRKNGEALALVCDVSEPESVNETVSKAVSHFGKLNGLCNIAGILAFENTVDVTLEDWNRIIAVNLTGTFLMCQAALPHLLETKGPIVNMSSTAALAGHPWTAAYAASKGGILALTYTLAIEYGRKGVRTNALCPGAVMTPIQQAFKYPEGSDESLLEKIMPFDDFRPPEDVAGAVAFLASDDSIHMNGSALRIDGGMLS